MNDPIHERLIRNVTVAARRRADTCCLVLCRIPSQGCSHCRLVYALEQLDRYKASGRKENYGNPR